MHQSQPQYDLVDLHNFQYIILLKFHMKWCLASAFIFIPTIKHIFLCFLLMHLFSKVSICIFFYFFLMGCLCLSYWFKISLFSIHNYRSSLSITRFFSQYLSFDTLVSLENVLKNTLSEYFILYDSLSLSIYLIIKNIQVLNLSLWSYISFIQLILRHSLIVL